MIHVAMSPVLHAEGCGTRQGSIVVGHHYTSILLRGIIVAFHLSFVPFCFLWAQFGVRTVLVLAFFQSLFYYLGCRSPRFKASLRGRGRGVGEEPNHTTA
jgi:hypothetical protein